MRNPLLASERVYLRPLASRDAEVMARASALEADTMMERMRVPTTVSGNENWMSELHKHQPPEEITFAVCLIEDDRYIGTVNLSRIDFVNRNAATGSWIDLPEFRGAGYGTEAKMLLLEYAFDQLGLHVLESDVWEPNARSAAALIKQGYRHAGRWKFLDLRDGVYRDSLLFDILRDDWLAARERLRDERGQDKANDPT